MVPTSYYVLLSAVLFALGVVGVLTCRNALIVFMSVEMMLNSANLALVAFAQRWQSANGQILVFFVIGVAAAEVAVGLALIEKARGESIPEWAYRDVLFMLIHYSIAAYQTLERKLSQQEKEEVFDVFYRFGTRMKLQGLPDNYNDWLKIRDEDMEHDLAKSDFTTDLYKQYKKHLGSFRYRVLIEGQIIVIPERARQLLNFRKFSFLYLFLPFYKLSRTFRLDGLIKSLILPAQYKKEIKAMDIV